MQAHCGDGRFGREDGRRHDGPQRQWERSVIHYNPVHQIAVVPVKDTVSYHSFDRTLLAAYFLMAYLLVHGRLEEKAEKTKA